MSLDPAVAAGLPVVKVVGTGLLGTSVGLGLAAAGARVLLADPSPTAVALARDLGAGEVVATADPADVARVGLVVVAAPPDVTADVVLAELAANPEATVTDVASVKSGILAEVAARGADLARYVGGHPMAGRERSGPVAARGDLFIGRPWVVCAGEKAESERVDLVRRLALALGAVPVVMPAAEHDASVAVVSHVPQVAASLVAARLRHVPDGAVALAGQGLRDVTRIASSDPLLWAQILSANAGPVVDVLRRLRSDLDAVIGGLESIAAEPGPHGTPGPQGPPSGPSGAAGAGPGGGVGPATAPGARAAVAKVVAEGNLGRERIPGKHGGQATRYSVVTVVIPDRPGSLARLFADIGDAGVNVEELALEHAPGRAVGLMEVSVLPAVRERLEEALAAAGWKVVA